MADQTNQWGSAPSTDSTAQALPMHGVAPLLPRRQQDRRRRLAAQRPCAAAGTVQYHGSVP